MQKFEKTAIGGQKELGRGPSLEGVTHHEVIKTEVASSALLPLPQGPPGSL